MIQWITDNEIKHEFALTCIFCLLLQSDSIQTAKNGFIRQGQRPVRQKLEYLKPASVM